MVPAVRDLSDGSCVEGRAAVGMDGPASHGVYRDCEHCVDVFRRLASLRQ